jgi:hypothetical protein
VKSVFAAICGIVGVAVVGLGVSDAAGAPTCYVAGQVHPRFEAVVTVNGETVKTVRPKKGRAKVFLTQFEAGLLRGGNNVLTVAYNVGPASRGNAPGPSFKVRVKCQDSPTDKKSAKVLSEIRGPGRPFPAAGNAGVLEDRFSGR